MHSEMFAAQARQDRGRDGWQTSCKKFLAWNYGSGPGVTMESMADGDGCGHFLVSRKSDAL